MFVSAIIVAAGGSTRMGISDSKQFIPLLGNPAIEYTLSAFEDCSLINEVVVVCREQDNNRIRAIADRRGFKKVSTIVDGGATRAESVKNGVAASSSEAQYLAIHDGARPLITAADIAKVCEAAFETGAATLGTPVTDTIKIVDGNNVIESTPDRSMLRAVQTPQVFEKEMYSFALYSEGEGIASLTDDCSLIEKMGGEVLIVEGSKENIKLTTPMDVLVAESILNSRKQVQ